MGIFKSMFDVGWTLVTPLRLETHYAWVSRLQTKDIDLTHQAWFTNLGKLFFTTSLITKFDSISQKIFQKGPNDDFVS